MNIFQEMFCAIAKVKSYPEFLHNRKGKVILYVAITVLLYSAIVLLRTIPSTMDAVSELRETVVRFPDFRLSAGKLRMEKSFYYEKDDILIVMESEYGSYLSESSISHWRETLYDYNIVAIMDETTILIKNNEEINIYDYPYGFQFSKDMMYEKIDYIYVIVAIFIVFSYLFSFMGYFLATLFVALVGMIICSFTNQKLTFGQIYLLSLYAKTLPLFIKGLLKAINFSVFGYSILAFTIACLYVGFAIHHMDMIDNEKKRIDGPIIF